MITEWRRALVRLCIILIFMAVAIVEAGRLALAETGGYPYAQYEGPGSSPANSYWTSRDGGDTSPYNYVYRNCTDYVAWKLVSRGVAVSQVNSLGNGGQWYNKAGDGIGQDIPRGTTPAIGAAAVRLPAGADRWGHVAYVEAVNANGTITVSEYNWIVNGVPDGAYHRRTGTPAALGFTRFVYFVHLMTSGQDAKHPAVNGSIAWTFENLDGDSAALGGNAGDVGRTPTTLYFDGRQYVFYYDAVGLLRYAFTNPSWVFNILDGAGGPHGRVTHAVGQTPTAIAFNKVLHLFYYDVERGNLRHGWSSSPADYNTWLFETLDGDAQAISGYNANLGQSTWAVEYGGTVHVFYYDASGGNVRHAWAGNKWSFENLDGDLGSIGRYNSNLGHDPAGVVWNGVLHLFYYDADQGNLRHAWANSNGWSFENLEGDVGAVSGYDADVGKNPTAVVYNNTLQVFYYAQTGGNLRHAWANASGWFFENLDGDQAAVLGYSANVGVTPAAAVIGGTLQVFAYEPSWGALRHYWADNTGWHGENLDGLGGNPLGRVNHVVGLDPAIGYNGTLQLFYYDSANGNLRHAFPSS